MIKVNKVSGTSGSGAAAAPLIIHGYRQGLSRSGSFYVKPNLPGEFTELQRDRYAKQISARFSAMAKAGTDDGFWSQGGLQINLYKEVVANGNYRLLETANGLSGIIFFKTYERGAEAENGVVRLVNEVADQQALKSGDFVDFLKAFCDEMKTDLGAKIVISQEKKGETALARVLLSLGFKLVDVSREPVQYNSYRTANVYAIYQRTL
jgi:hypothetical protein